MIGSSSRRISVIYLEVLTSRQKKTHIVQMRCLPRVWNLTIRSMVRARSIKRWMIASLHLSCARLQNLYRKIRVYSVFCSKTWQMISNCALILLSAWTTILCNKMSSRRIRFRRQLLMNRTSRGPCSNHKDLARNCRAFILRKMISIQSIAPRALPIIQGSIVVVALRSLASSLQVA